MKALSCISPGHLSYVDVPEPVLTPGQSIIKIQRVGICGTDLHAFKGDQPYFEYPRILGHELAGEVVAPGDAAEFATGESVTFIPYFNCGFCYACQEGHPNCCVHLKVCGVHMDGGMTVYLSVPSRLLLHGNGLTADQLALVEPLAIGAHGTRRAGIRSGEFVMVIGAGPIGLGTMEFAQLAGGRVIAMDTNQSKLAFCQEKLKIPHVIDASTVNVAEQLQAITGGRMADVVIDATGNRAAINKSFDYIAHAGRYVLIGLQKETILFSHPEFHKREATLMSSRNALKADFETVMDALATRRIDPLNYITHRADFGDTAGSFPDWMDPASGVIKAMVTMS